MIATPVTDEFLRDFELVLIRMNPKLIPHIKAGRLIEGFDVSDGEFWMPNETNHPDYKSKAVNVWNFIEGNRQIAKQFNSRVKQVIHEAESLILVDNIARWVHIFRVKCEKAGGLLTERHRQKEANLFWDVFQEMETDGVHREGEYAMLFSACIGDCSSSWLELKDFFENCKKMVELPEEAKNVETSSKTGIDYFLIYKETLIPKYISNTQEIELRNLLKVYHTPNRINWLGTIDSLVSTVHELRNKGVISIAEGITIKQYILYNFTHKGSPINEGTLANALSKPENNP